MNAPAGTVVDSSVLFDIFTEDPVWGEWSLGQLTGAAQRGGLILNAVVMAEIAHAAVTGRPLLTRDPQRVATHIPSESRPISPEHDSSLRSSSADGEMVPPALRRCGSASC